jgi:hypothetical protein
MEVGDVHKTGNAEKGGVTFEVKNFKSDPKIWPHETMFGIFEETYGEQQIFNFLELGFSDKEIHSLAQALHGENGRYFIGVTCLDDKVCNFDAASPMPHQKELDWTPAMTSQEIFMLQ